MKLGEMEGENTEMCANPLPRYQAYDADEFHPHVAQRKPKRPNRAEPSQIISYRLQRLSCHSCIDPVTYIMFDRLLQQLQG